jgi:hypothetical protein
VCSGREELRASQAAIQTAISAEHCFRGGIDSGV